MALACSNCIYWQSYDDDNTTQGVCHRHPPTPLRSDGLQITSSFPVTRSDMWCGEHQASAS